MGSAQLDMLAFEETAISQAVHLDASRLSASDDLKHQVAERLRSHRERRRRASDPAHPPLEPRPRPSSLAHTPHAAAVAHSVAARFAQTPSYRAILAQQAERATQQAAAEARQAAAEAEIAARNLHAIAEAQQQLLAELELWDAPQHFTPATAEVIQAGATEAASPAPARSTPCRVSAAGVAPPEAAALPFQEAAAPPVKEVASAGFTVRLYEDLGPTPRRAAINAPAREALGDSDEALALDEEIAFRQSPVFEPFFIEPTTPLPANLLEFPRQLVAARKARPRLAEGPLLDEPAPRNPQLRIFEVEPEQISEAPAPPAAYPEWLSIRLGAYIPTDHPEPAANAPAILPSMPLPQTAPLSLRLMSALVDGSLVSFAFLALVAVTARIAGAVPTGIPAVIAAAVTLTIFYLLYELLFFSFSDQTPGMRYARIGLCTLTDENPSRRAMRRRILAQIVALCPFGIGFLWALLDDEGLGWHDRISRMYQRAY